MEGAPRFTARNFRKIGSAGKRLSGYMDVFRETLQELDILCPGVIRLRIDSAGTKAITDLLNRQIEHLESHLLGSEDHPRSLTTTRYEVDQIARDISVLQEGLRALAEPVPLFQGHLEQSLQMIDITIRLIEALLSSIEERAATPEAELRPIGRSAPLPLEMEERGQLMRLPDRKKIEVYKKFTGALLVAPDPRISQLRAYLLENPRIIPAHAGRLATWDAVPCPLSPEVVGVRQGQLGDCYLMATLSALIKNRVPIADQLIRQLDEQIPEEPVVFSVKLFLDDRGTPQVREVLVDTREILIEGTFPLDAARNPLYSGRITGREDIRTINLAALLIEKAYAKAMGGYAHIASGSPEQAFKLLTGREAVRLPLTRVALLAARDRPVVCSSKRAVHRSDHPEAARSDHAILTAKIEAGGIVLYDQTMPEGPGTIECPFEEDGLPDHVTKILGKRVDGVRVEYNYTYYFDYFTCLD
jgi:hypothetical protein